MLKSPEFQSQPPDIAVIYDGECPVCRNYVTMLRLKDTARGAVTLVDARTDPDLVERLRAEGYEINEGMVVRVAGQIYFGSDAVHALAILSTDNSLINKINRMILGNRTACFMLYPAMRFGRNLLLKIIGKKLIS